MFSSLPRADQRRWAEVYVRGLLNVAGRKTVRRISAEVAGGGAEQCLQQFVNQSTWRPDPIRRDLARQLAGALTPSFWVLEDVVIPKNGRHSAAVGLQFAHLEGRALNCQLGLGLFLAGDGWSCPVNWRLRLPAAWQDDTERRSRAHVPVAERQRPRWEHMLEVIDETAADWLVAPRPVLGDLTADAEVEPFLRGLEERRLPYVMKVVPNRPGVAVHARAAPRRYLVAGRPTARDSPRTAWVTSFPPGEVAHLLDAVGRFSGVRTGLSALYEELGLRHFEGRSYVGWHHYATLVSVASACRALAADGQLQNA